MESLRSLSVVASVVASLPIFVIGGSLVFGGDGLALFGLGAMAYAVLSFVSLVVVSRNPIPTVLIADRCAIAVLLAFAIWFFLWRGIFESGWLFAAGAIVVFAVKWLSIAYVFHHQPSNA